MRGILTDLEEEPIAETFVMTEAPAENKATRKRRKHGDQKQPTWRSKIQRKTTGEGEDEQTISMYLRKADTVIDVSIKSPVKKKHASKRLLQEVTECDESSGSLRVNSSSATERAIQKSKTSRLGEYGGTNPRVNRSEYSRRERSGKQ